jgi:hypothetical protein
MLTGRLPGQARSYTFSVESRRNGWRGIRSGAFGSLTFESQST